MAGEAFADRDRVVFRGLIVVGVAEAVRYAWLLVLTGMLGRALSEADFGFIRLVPAIQLVAYVVLDLGAGSLIAREAARDPARERPLLEAAFCVRAMVAIVLGIIVGAAAFGESDPERRMWLLITAASLPGLAPAVVGAAFRVRQDQVAPAVISIANILLMIAATAVLTRLRAPGPAFAVIFILREIAGSAAIWFVARRRHGVRIQPGLAGRGAAAFYRAAVPMNLAVTFQVLSLNLGVFFVRAWFGDEELGSYAAAHALVLPFLLLMGSLAAPLLPVLARGPAFDRIVTPALAITCGVALLAAGFVFGAGRDALRLVYDSREAIRYSQGAFDAVPALQWLGLAFCAVCVGAIATTALVARDGDRALRGITGVALGLNAAVALLLAGTLARASAAAGLLAAEAWTALAALAALARRGAAPDGAAILRGALPVAPLGAAMLLLPAEWPPIARVALAAACAGCGLAWLLAGPPGRALRAGLAERAP